MIEGPTDNAYFNMVWSAHRLDEPMPKPRDPMVTVNMQVDLAEISEQAKAGLADVSHRAMLFAEEMDRLGVRVAVIISVLKDPR